MKIIVNGSEKEWRTPRISYTDICKLAGQRGSPSVVYRRESGHDGILAPGDVIAADAGMIFNAVHTGNA